MELFKVTVAVDGRDIETRVKKGVLASIELGKHKDKKKQPAHKVNLIVGESLQGDAAWIQISKFDSNGNAFVTQEGWINNSAESRKESHSSLAIKASLQKIDNPSLDEVKCQDEASFGALSCCTSYGNNCYVTCCNGCCADPYGCPGASCCG